MSSPDGWRAGVRGGGFAAIGVDGSSAEGGCGGQAIAGKGVYLGNRLEEVGLLTEQAGEIMSDRKPRNGRAVEGGGSNPPFIVR